MRPKLTLEILSPMVRKFILLFERVAGFRYRLMHPLLLAGLFPESTQGVQLWVPAQF